VDKKIIFKKIILISLSIAKIIVVIKILFIATMIEFKDISKDFKNIYL